MTLTDADIVCARAKNHFDPQAEQPINFSDSLEEKGASTSLENYKKNFKALHNTTALSMYFS